MAIGEADGESSTSIGYPEIYPDRLYGPLMTSLLFTLQLPFRNVRMHSWPITWKHAVWKRNQTLVPGILRITIYTSTEWLKRWKHKNIDTILSKMEDYRLAIDDLDETQNEREPLLRPESSPTYLHFRPGREPQQANRFTAFVLSVFKVTFCSLGL